IAAAALAVGVMGLGAGWLAPGHNAAAIAQQPAKTAKKPADPAASPKPGPADPTVVEVKDPEAAKAEQERKLKLLQEHRDSLSTQLRNLDLQNVQQSLTYRDRLIELEEKAKTMERIRAIQRQRELEAKSDEREIITKEEKHTAQVVALRREMVRIESEHAVREREHAEKREQIAAKMHAITAQMMEQEFGPAKAIRQPDRADLERRIAAMERELAELRREMRGRGKE